MVLLSSMIRSQAITGSTDASWFQWIVGQQGGRWADQHVRAALPTTAQPGTPAADPAESLRNLTELHERGIVTDAEFDRLRGRLNAG
jgi:hypothetical protein